MSLRSMTGHGFAVRRTKAGRVTVNISSVNRRQLDVAIKLPKMLVAWEPRVEEIVASYVSRGRVAGTVDVEWSSAWRRRQVRVDADLAKGYVRELRRMTRALKLKDDLTASALVNLPEVVRYDEEGAAGQEVWKEVEICLREALAKVVRARDREGHYLRRDLEKRLGLLERGVRKIERRAPQVSARYREQLIARLGAAGISVEAADDRLLREVALFADRVDITEEITRLQGHIAEFRRWLKLKGSVGRTLDFTVQEMLREVNTIGSKANDIAISKQVVMLKTELERIREQVQNIE